MPSTSAKQAKFMRAVAHSPSFAKKVGVAQSVGEDFSKADKKMKKFGKGGGLKDAPGTNDPDYGDEGVMKAKPKPKPKVPLKPAPGTNDPYESTPKTGPDMPKRKLGPAGKAGFKCGGKAMKKYAKGGGIEKKGKTKGTIIKMAKGGSIDGIAMKGKTRCKGAK